MSSDPKVSLLYLCVFQLILPECMKLLPVYLNCVMKSDVLLPGADVSLDDRAYLRQLISCMDVSETQVFFYPRLLPLVRSHSSTEVSCHLMVRFQERRIRSCLRFKTESIALCFSLIVFPED